MAEALATASVDIRANTVTMAKDLREAVGLWEKASRDIESVRSKVEKSFYFKVGEKLFEGVTELTHAMAELAEKGEKAGSIKQAFDALGGSTASIDNARKSIVGLVDSYDLMQIANKGLLAQIPNFNKSFADIADLGGRWANAFGKDTRQSIEDLTTAIVKGDGKALKPLGFTFTNLKDKALVTKQALMQVTGIMGNLPPVTDSAANALKSLHNSFEDVIKQIGIGVNESPQLTKAIRDFEKAIGDTDWEGFGRAIASIESVLFDLGTTVLPVVVAGFKDLAAVIDYTVGKSADAQFLRLSERLNAVREQMESLQAVEDRAKQNGGEGGLSGPGADRLTALKAEYETLMAQAKGLNDQILKTQTGVKDIETHTPKMFGHEFQQGAAEAQQKLEAIQDAWKKTVDAIDKKKIENSLDISVKNLDVTAFENLKAQLAKNVEDGFVDGQQKAIDAGVVDEASVRALGAEQGQIIAEETQKKMDEALKQSVDVWRTLFQNAITGVSFDLKDMLKQVAVGFAAQIAQSALGSLGNLKSPMDIGGFIASKLGLGGTGGGTGGIIGSLINGGARPEGVAGPLMADGSFSSTSLSSIMGSMVPVAAVAVGTYLAGKSAQDILKGKTDNSPQGIAGRAQLAFTTMGGSEIARFFGFGGSKNKDTIARNQVSDLFDQKGLAGFDFGAAQFNPGGKAFQGFDKLSLGAKQSFTSIGNYIKDMLGITQDVGPQISSILTDGVGGSVEKLGAAMKKLGITVEDVETSMLAAGKAGQKSWLEVEGSIEGAERAATAGQESMTAAVQELINSGGRGQDALDGVRDAAIVAQRESAKMLADYRATLEKQKNLTADQIDKMVDSKQMEEFKKQLANGGLDQAGIDKIMQALAQRNITNLDQLTQSSDRTAGAVVADLDAMGFGFNKMADKVNEATTAIEKFADAVSSIPGAPNPVDGTPKMAAGGVLMGPTRITAGEAGPEAIMPLRRVNGRLGVAVAEGGNGRGASTIIVNAQNAAAGTETMMRRLMRDYEDRIVKRAVSTVHSQGLRMS